MYTFIAIKQLQDGNGSKSGSRSTDKSWTEGCSWVSARGRSWSRYLDRYKHTYKSKYTDTSKSRPMSKFLPKARFWSRSWPKRGYWATNISCTRANSTYYKYQYSKQWTRKQLSSRIKNNILE